MLSFENSIDESINKKIIALHQAFEKNKFAGCIETVPAYSSLAVFYDLSLLKKNYGNTVSAYDVVKEFTEKLVSEINPAVGTIKRDTISIPVYYDGEDLEYLAGQHGLSSEEVILIHSSRTYRVFMIGFLPGFAYMGKVDQRIATPRMVSPRTKVRAGSVGIAGFQTGIYPMDSPGGWQLIGQTPLKIFDKHKANPCLLQAGDQVQFVSIGKDAFESQYEY